MKPKPVPPGPGQESVWDYPRPPRLEAVDDEIDVYFAGQGICFTDAPLRVLETSHPPVYYVPPDSLEPDVLEASGTTSFCEFKGDARYFDVVVGDKRSKDAAWTYDNPLPGYEAMSRLHRLLPGPGGMPPRGRGRPAPAGRLLRRLDHHRRRRPLQGADGHPRLVGPTRLQAHRCLTRAGGEPSRR